jgi:uncharacterized pyridoxal phosphate-dependent enzyme
MSRGWLGLLQRSMAGLTRRELLWSGGALSLAPLWARGVVGSAKGPAAKASSGVVAASSYESIGVRPVINCRGTLTVMGGSLELPEVRAAQEAAAEHFVVLDEMMEGIGKRLAELTGAEWGMFACGCAASIAHSTAASVAGGDPDLHTRIPDLTGFAKDQVVIPAHSRNEYDQAIRSIGVKVVEVADGKELEAALGPQVAMVYVLAGPRAETGPLGYDAIFSAAKQRGIPVFVDAAAENLTIPCIHLQRGATLVGYSGGKCLRGPQSSGLLLGRKDLVKAAWVHSAPHHGYGRTMKLGKEEAMGLLAAVEAWTKRDHDAEFNEWTQWMKNIAGRLESVQGVKAEIRQPEGLSNHTPSLSIRWDTQQIGISGEEVSKTLLEGEPRIALNAGGGRRRGANSPQTATGVSIIAYNMKTGEDKVVAERLHEVLSKAAGKKLERDETPAAANVTGEWDVAIEFAAGKGSHRFYLAQDGSAIRGTHQGEFVTRDLAGNVAGPNLKFTSAVGEEHGAALTYTFTGTVNGDSMAGDLDMGEYLGAKWSAQRHQYHPG